MSYNIFEIRERIKKGLAVPESARIISETVRKEPSKIIEKQAQEIKQYFTDVIRLTRPLRCSILTVKTTPTLILKPPHEWPYLIVNPSISVGLTSSYQLFNGTATANGNTQANPIGCANFLNAHFFAVITSISGSWDIILQAKDPITNTWVDIQAIFSITSAGQYYATVGSLGVVTDIAIRWEGSGSFTGTISMTLKGGVQGGPTGVSRVIFLGDKDVTPETGLTLFEGQDRIIMPVYDIEVYAIAYTEIPIKVFIL